RSHPVVPPRASVFDQPRTLAIHWHAQCSHPSRRGITHRAMGGRMSARAKYFPPEHPSEYTENQRFKERSRMRLFVAIAVAAVAHFLVFSFSPLWTTPPEEVFFVPAAEMRAIALAPNIAVPVAPAAIPAPA